MLPKRLRRRRFTRGGAGQDTNGNFYGTTFGNDVEGGAPFGTVFSLSLGPAVGLAPGMLNFGPQGLNIPNTPQTVTLTNTCSQLLSIASIMVTGTNNRDFFESDNCPRNPNTLAPGNHCTMQVVFSPIDTGTLNADVTITDNASDSPQMVPP